MAFVITQPCIDTQDQACVEVCPVDCIHFEEGADRMLYINPLECIDCGACQPACPVNAIFPLADVPTGSQQFIQINELWYSDPAAARGMVGGGAPAAQPAAAAAPAAESQAVPEAAAEAAATAETAPAAAPPAAAPAQTVSAPVAAASAQVEATDDGHHGPVVVPHYNPPSPKGLIAFAMMAVSFAFMWLTPGPEWLEFGDVGVGAGVIIGVPVFILGLLGFLDSQIRDLGLFAARQPRSVAYWREGRTEWRRSENTRRYELERAVQELAAGRFAFPSPDHPDYRTHVNLPEPSMALEFGGGGQKVFPDILVVRYPGNYPVMVAQIETGETVTREQAKRVWKQLENEDAPLYVYVPSGYGTAARDYAKGAGIKHVKFRTWRRQPNGMMVEDV